MDRRLVEDRVLEMLESTKSLPPPPSRSQTMPNPPSPSSSQKEASGWWAAAKSKLTPTKDKDLTPAQQIIQEAKAREKGVATFRTVLEPARRVLKEQPFLSGEQPAYPDYALAGTFLWARIASPLALLEADDPIHAWRERMLDLFDGMGRKARAA